ncbi:hypothetical protein [Streptomyces aureus]|uniref:hypothetical protein n=1 Tax=Streptomyces aureus TaxID=193461 RepID=UPI00131C0188|nr:hypothetical protein [Streptomyces aureus]
MPDAQSIGGVKELAFLFLVVAPGVAQGHDGEVPEVADGQRDVFGAVGGGCRDHNCPVVASVLDLAVDGASALEPRVQTGCELLEPGSGGGVVVTAGIFHVLRVIELSEQSPGALVIDGHVRLLLGDGGWLVG